MGVWPAGHGSRIKFKAGLHPQNMEWREFKTKHRKGSGRVKWILETGSCWTSCLGFGDVQWELLTAIQSLLLCSCDVFRALFNSLCFVDWIVKQTLFSYIVLFSCCILQYWMWIIRVVAHLVWLRGSFRIACALVHTHTLTHTHTHTHARTHSLTHSHTIHSCWCTRVAL